MVDSNNLRVQTRGMGRSASPGPSSSRRNSVSSPTEGQHKPLKERTSSFTKNILRSNTGLPSSPSMNLNTRSFSTNNLSASNASSTRGAPAFRSAQSTNSFSNNVPISSPGFLTSPSMASLPSLGPNGSGLASSSSSANLISKFDARNVAMAMHRLENKDNHNVLDAKAGELGSVGAIGFGGGDEWQTVCVRVLPLFNGEGTKGYIEDLNELVILHIQRITSRSEKRAIQYLNEHLSELLATGMLTLNSKLQGLSDERLLVRLNEVWTFFFTSILPYLMGVFVPFATDRDLLRIAAKQASANQQPLSVQLKPAVNVRQSILISFRDHIIFPVTDHLANLFSENAIATPPGRMSQNYGLSGSNSFQPGQPIAATPTMPRPKASIDGLSTASNASQPTSETLLNQAKRMQMISILSSVLTGDDKQAAMEYLGRSLRGGYRPSRRESAETPGGKRDRTRR